MQTIKTNFKINLSIMFTMAILLTILLAATSTQANAATTNVNILIKNEPVQFTEQTGKPFIDSNNRTLVPMRVVMEKYGCTVDWEQESMSAIVKKGDIIVKVPTKQKYILVNDNRVEGDTTPQIINGRTYLPIAVVLRAVGADVKWDNDSRSVVVDGAGQGVNPVTTIPAMNVGDSNPAAGVGDKPEGYDEFMKDFEVIDIQNTNKENIQSSFLWVKNNKLNNEELENFFRIIPDSTLQQYFKKCYFDNEKLIKYNKFHIGFFSKGVVPSKSQEWKWDNAYENSILTVTGYKTEINKAEPFYWNFVNWRDRNNK